eukprot:80280-Hanusia_phi.AAC.2
MTRKQGNTCLHYCFGYNYTELGEYLISKGADESIRNHLNATCREPSCPASPFDVTAIHGRRSFLEQHDVVQEVNCTVEVESVLYVMKSNDYSNK